MDRTSYPEKNEAHLKVAKAASLILAAGRGSRMKGYTGNKALLPLIPGKTPYEGDLPILLHILRNLPAGPKGVVVHHRKEDVISATSDQDLIYLEQPELNGTGGALLAAASFLETQPLNCIIITMGDVPFVTAPTYKSLVQHLRDHSLVVLGFAPSQKKQYGVLDIEENRVKRIIEWKYWQTYPIEKQHAFEICNSGIYAVRKEDLLHCLPMLASRPHRVLKNVDGKPTEVQEFFITDLVQYMFHHGLQVGYALAADEKEVMGIDDLPALLEAQQIFSQQRSHS